MDSTKWKINVGGSLIDLHEPLVMGIINLTADSFYDGGKIKSDKDLLEKVEKMMSEGVDLFDVGAYSTRPGAKDIPVSEERSNSVNGISTILDEFPSAVISCDTFRSEVASAAIEAGAGIVNDVSAGQLDDQMFKVVSELRVPYIMMHMRGNPKTMMQLTDYDDLISEIIDYFNDKIVQLKKRGVADIIIDPGFGFAKTRDQNFYLLNHLNLLKALERPILCGVSRKSMIWKSLDITADEALNGTTVLNTVSILNGASILRVHDVKEAREAIKLCNLVTKEYKKD